MVISAGKVRVRQAKITKSQLEDLISSRTGINTMTAEDPMTCVAIGTGKYVEFLAGCKEEIN